MNADQWTIDLTYNLGNKDRLHGYYNLFRTSHIEPNRNGNTIPGFGNTSRQQRQVFTLNETHIFDQRWLTKASARVQSVSLGNYAKRSAKPADFGINNGITQAIGLPQISVAGGLNFGGPSINPSGRGDTTVVINDTLNYQRGKHSLKLGGEFRQFFNNNFRQGTGSFNFPTVASFIAAMLIRLVLPSAANQAA